jgi:hypothetical protein
LSAALTAPYLASVGLLAAAGVAKVLAPTDTARALAAARLRLGRRAVRAGAAAEIAVAVGAAVGPGPVFPALVAVSYLGFAAFLAVALRRGWAISSCGCFGRPDTPPTRGHVALNLAAALTACVWAVTGPSTLWSAFSGQPWNGVPLLVAGAAIGFLAWLLFVNPVPAARLSVRAASTHREVRP